MNLAVGCESRALVFQQKCRFLSLLEAPSNVIADAMRARGSIVKVPARWLVGNFFGEISPEEVSTEGTRKSIEIQTRSHGVFRREAVSPTIHPTFPWSSEKSITRATSRQSTILLALFPLHGARERIDNVRGDLTSP